jgi:hypothetical protein
VSPRPRPAMTSDRHCSWKHERSVVHGDGWHVDDQVRTLRPGPALRRPADRCGPLVTSRTCSRVRNGAKRDVVSGDGAFNNQAAPGFLQRQGVDEHDQVGCGSGHAAADGYYQPEAFGNWSPRVVVRRAMFWSKGSIEVGAIGDGIEHAKLFDRPRQFEQPRRWAPENTMTPGARMTEGNEGATSYPLAGSPQISARLRER